MTEVILTYTPWYAIPATFVLAIALSRMVRLLLGGKR